EGTHEALAGNHVGRQAIDALAVEDDGAAGWLEKAGDEVERGRLPRAVGANQAGNGAPADAKATVIDRPHPTEHSGEIGHLQDRVALAGSRPRRRLRRSRQLYSLLTPTNGHSRAADSKQPCVGVPARHKPSTANRSL